MANRTNFRILAEKMIVEAMNYPFNDLKDKGWKKGDKDNTCCHDDHPGHELHIDKSDDGYNIKHSFKGKMAGSYDDADKAHKAVLAADKD